MSRELGNVQLSNALKVLALFGKAFEINDIDGKYLKYKSSSFPLEIIFNKAPRESN